MKVVSSFDAFETNFTLETLQECETALTLQYQLSFWSSSFWLHVFSDFCNFDLVSCSCFYFLFCLFSVLLTLCLFDLLSFQHFIFLICCLLNLWSFRLFVFFYFVSFEFLSFWMFLIVWLFCLFDFSEGPKPGTLRIFKFLLQNNCFP